MSMGKQFTSPEAIEIQEAIETSRKLQDEANINLAKQQVYNGGGGLVEQAFSSYRFRTETAKEMLKDSRRAYEKSCDDVVERTGKVTELVAEMKRLAT